MSCITVVPMTLPELLSDAAKSAICSEQPLFLQTEQHPFAQFILDRMLPYVSMDDLYESSADFNALNEAIAARLVTAGACVYATTGSIAATLLPVIKEAAVAAGISVKVLPGLSPASAAFPDRQIDASFPAAQLPERLTPTLHIAVEEVCDAIFAGEVKLALSEYYPDEWEIQIADVENGRYQARAIPLYLLDRQPDYHATTVVYVPAAPFDRLARFGYEDLRAVLTRLRAPGGCPWDREQTHESLKAPLLEECYELIDAIESKDDVDLCEELGDVLMQVVFHALLAAEQGRFTDRDVTTEIVQKLIYRHPHVFGNIRVDSAADVLQNWDKLKMVEKHQQTQTETLRSVPRCFPALTRASKVQKKAAKVGFDWPDAQSAFPKIAEEAAELQCAMLGDGDVAEETGDLLFAAVNVARLLGLDPEFLLRDATDKFIDRFSDMENFATADGISLDSLSFSELDQLWQKAKISRKV